MIAARRHNGTPTAQSIAVTALVLAAALLALPSIAQAESCPNEQLRAENRSTSLPDCRAYELVTPPFKYGNPAFLHAVSSTGSAVQLDSLGSWGEVGEENSTSASQYIARRTPAGWTTVAIAPSLSEFQSNSFDEAGENQDFSPDLAKSIFGAAPLSDSPIDQRFYVRESDGAHTEVGPLLPPESVALWAPEDAQRHGEEAKFHYSGASADFSRVLFTIESGVADIEPIDWYWPGDQTRLAEEHRPNEVDAEVQSLYEYAETNSSEPELVGVRNATTLAAAAAAGHKQHINEAAEQISDCGDALGSRGSQMTHNAIAGEGETIFFTVKPCELHSGEPRVVELYARIARDRTVAISEPTEAQCAECRTGSSKTTTEEREAQFVGASQSGTYVYFRTTQALLPGAVGESLYQYDFAAPEDHKVRLLAVNLAPGGGVVAVSNDGSRVYYASQAALPEVSANQYGATPKPGEDNLYLYDQATGGNSYVATLSEEDGSDWAVGPPPTAEATPSDENLVFESVADLTNEQASGEQAYWYDAASGRIERVTAGADGYDEDGRQGPAPGTSLIAAADDGGKDGAETRPVMIAEDGSMVFFTSPEALTPQALADACVISVEGECRKRATNIYEWEDGNVYLLSDGQDTHVRIGQSATSLDGASPSGQDVFITSADALTREDVSPEQGEVYDVRVNGGFTAASPPTSCSEACTPTVEAAQAWLAPQGTATFTGPGNLPPAAQPVAHKQACPKKEKRVHGKCRKPQKKKRKVRSIRRTTHGSDFNRVKEGSR